jgi:competence protein ComEA
MTGTTERLKLTALTLAAVLLAGPAVLGAAAGQADGEKAAPAGGVVNVNTADAEQLALLPRIGPAVAQRILEHREKNGPFKTADELMLVRGVGERTFELLKPHISLTGNTTLTEKVRVPRQPAAGQDDD